MTRKTVRVINLNKNRDLLYVIQQLEAINYVVSDATIKCNLEVLIEEVETSIKCNDVVILLAGLGWHKSYPVWKALSHVFHQPIVIDLVDNTFATRYSKCFRNDRLHSVSYIQGVYIIDDDDYEDMRVSLSSVVLPILRNFNRTPAITKTLVLNQFEGGGMINLLPHTDKVKVTYDSHDGKFILHLSSTSMTYLLNYEISLAKVCNVHSSKSSDISELVYNQTDLHIKKSLECIEDCLKKYLPENIFLSFNGGKDCTVLLHLVIGALQKNYPDYNGKLFCVYIENRNSFPELNKFIEDCRQYYDLDLLKLTKPIKESLLFILSEKPNMMGVLMGTRSTDPFSEHLQTFQMTDKNWPQIMRVSPLLDWHYSQIWDYLLHLKVPYCSLYDAGYTSLGSATNTIPNPCLLNKETNTFLPAYKLLDATKERSDGDDIKIVGGTDAEEGAYPYQASLRRKGRHFCGGSVIGDQWILTAAHCVFKQDPSLATVVVGTNLLDKGGDSYEIKEYIPHKNYDPETIINDIALIYLKKTLNQYNLVKVVPLAENDTPADNELILTGWGLTGLSFLNIIKTTPNKLQMIKLKSISNEKCAKEHPTSEIRASNICTFTKIGQGACYGDSGGPLVADGKQVGVVSWGKPCAKGKPDVFTRTYSYLDWIAEHMKI
ncbi:hypothetical protein FQA39_LY07735 [Lamprigera yunnana]|nr:hypothetical protein FQA39_LY07735 [Lamprigera yunnana]